MESTQVSQTETTTLMKKSHPIQKHLSKTNHGDVSNRVTLFQNRAEALSKPTPEWTINPEDPL